MDLIHIELTFEDTFSFAKAVRYTTVSLPTFEKMKAQIGTVVINRFNKKYNIHENLRLVSVTQSK